MIRYEPSRTCPACQLGSLHPVRSVYFTTVAGWPLCAQDVPAWYCLICGHHEYDPGAITRLLNPGWPGRVEPTDRRRQQLDSDAGGGSSPEEHRRRS